MPKERELAALHEATRELIQCSTPEEVADVATGAARHILGLRLSGVFLADEDGLLVPVATTSESDEVLGEPPAFEPGQGLIGRVFETGDPIVCSDVRNQPAVYNPETPIRSEMIFPLGEYGVFVAGSTDADAFTDADVTLARILSSNASAVLGRISKEQALLGRTAAIEALHTATRELMQAESREDVAEITADAAKNTLNYPINVVRYVSDDGSTLEPVAATRDARHEMGSRPAYSIEETPAGWAYERGEPVVFEDIRDADDGIDRGKIRAAMYLPIGEYGTISIDDTQAGKFDQADVELAKILTANAEAALARVEYERMLQERTHEIEQQNERLEEFVSVLSHDLRSPLNVALVQLKREQERCQSGGLETIEGALTRMRELIEDLLSLARHGRAVDEFEAVDLGGVVTKAWSTVDTASATLEEGDDLPVVEADGNRLRELLENLFRNAIEHAGSDVTITVGRLPGGFYLEDDGPGIPEDERESVFRWGYSTAEGGSGLGLSIVKQIVEAHGWDVDLSASESGGARYEVTGVTIV